MRRPRLIIAVAIAALALAGPAAAAGPHLALTRWQPPKVKGTGFHRHEKVTVVVRQNFGPRLTRHVRATSSGSFRVTFSQSVPPCGNFQVSATGSMGSRARLAGMKYPDCVIR